MSIKDLSISQPWTKCKLWLQ